MSRSRFIAVAVAMGVALPLAWLAIYWALLRGNPALINSLMSSGHLDRVLLALWPGWLLFIADPEEGSIAIPAVAIGTNALLYGVIGWLAWVGLTRRRVVLLALVAGVIAGWYLLLRWYGGA